MHTLAQLLHRFALRNTAIRRAVDQLATPALFFFAQRVDMALLQHAHIQLAQARIGDHAAAAGFGDDLCCAAGSTQIAGNDMGNPQRSGALANLPGLALTVCGQRAVGLALNTSLGVPLRFTVANKVYL
jgi:hypothetical protein